MPEGGKYDHKATTNCIIVSRPPPACQIDYGLKFDVYYNEKLLSNVQLRKTVKFILVYLTILMLAL